MNGRQAIREECLANVLDLLQSAPSEGDVQPKRRICIAAGRLAAMAEEVDWQHRMAETEVEQLAYSQVLWPKVRAWLGEDGYSALTTGSLEPLIELTAPAGENFEVALALLHQRLAAAWLLEGLRALWPEQGDFIERWMRGPAGLDRVDHAIVANYRVPGYIDEALGKVAEFCNDIPVRRSYGPTLGRAISVFSDRRELAAAHALQGASSPMKPEQSLLIDDWLRQEHPDAGLACSWDQRIQSPVVEHGGKHLPVLCFNLAKNVVDIPETRARDERTGAFALEAIKGFDEDGAEDGGPLLAIDVRQLGTCELAGKPIRKLALDGDSEWLHRWMQGGRV
jgi:hypothetical protein